VRASPSAMLHSKKPHCSVGGSGPHYLQHPGSSRVSITTMGETGIDVDLEAVDDAGIRLLMSDVCVHNSFGAYSRNF